MDQTGKPVSLDCGSLGFFQGTIENLDMQEETLTIKDVFKNGKPSEMSKLTFR